MKTPFVSVPSVKSLTHLFFYVFKYEVFYVFKWINLSGRLIDQRCPPHIGIWLKEHAKRDIAHWECSASYPLLSIAHHPLAVLLGNLTTAQFARIAMMLYEEAANPVVKMVRTRLNDDTLSSEEQNQILQVRPAVWAMSVAERDLVISLISVVTVLSVPFPIARHSCVGESHYKPDFANVH